MSDEQSIEEEIARTLRDADPEPYLDGGWGPERYYAELAKSLTPLLNRVRAEAQVEAAPSRAEETIEKVRSWNTHDRYEPKFWDLHHIYATYDQQNGAADDE